MQGDLTVRLAEQSAVVLPPIVWNEDEVSAALDEMLASYKGRQYTPEDIKGAKADRAAVNRIEKQLAAAQKAVTDLYKQPVEDFAAKMRLYRAKTKEVSDAINDQVRAVEQAQRAEKMDALAAVYRENASAEIKELIPFERLADERWGNASFSAAEARREMLARIETCKAELDTLRKMCGEDFPAVERVYLSNLSIHSAISEYNRICEMRKAQAAAEAARRAEQAEREAAPIIMPPTQEQREARAEGARRAETNAVITEDGRIDFSAEKRPYDFRCWMDAADIAALKEFFKIRGIRYGRVPEK